ncbi:hypothetical protein FOA43_004275 [Brettanomyces nanus]|uniref:PH domain-containing protein n=1 Tax=Eeniella nana TaxID=13502 RepID=A0A875S5H5_EENNA|nr:uncharacterized protein FOA43_004275 [Brettanomyces nanus]QPG76881.1 hypothetical protein FOA43_004275 [Brettanomyces nanus]
MGTLMRKMEWVSPYEMAIQRQWKMYIVELNSTQLNIYDYDADEANDSNLHGSASRSFLHLHRLHHNSSVSNSSSYCQTTSPQIDLSKYQSRLTTKEDLERLKLFHDKKMLNQSNLVSSYSLQYGRIGLAIDYKKKKYTLRLRLQTEQFLLQFSCAETMIEWYTALSLGIDNALEISKRPMPKYRTVPRRRRHVHSSAQRIPLISNGRHHSIENLFSRRTDSSPDLGSFISKLKFRFGSGSGSGSGSGGGSRDESSGREEFQQQVQPPFSLLSIYDMPENHSEESMAESEDRRVSTDTRSGCSEQEQELGDSHTLLSSSPPQDSQESINSLDEGYEVEDELVDPVGVESIGDTVSHNGDDGIFFEASHPYNSGAASSLRQPRRQRALSSSSYSLHVTASSVSIHPVAMAMAMPIPNLRLAGSHGNARMTISSSLSPSISIESASASSPISAMSSPGLGLTTPTTSITSSPRTSNYIEGNGIDQLDEGGDDTYTAIMEKLRSCVDVIAIPNRRRQIRDSVRCMVPLVGSERWAGRFVVKDAVMNYHPKQNKNATNEPLITRWDGLNMERPSYEQFRPLQEYLVTTRGLIAKINHGFEGNRFA